MDNNKEIGLRLQKIRCYLNLSQNDLATELELTQSAISNYEKGNRQLSNLIIKYLCIRYNINKSYLLTGIGNMINTETDTDIFKKFCNVYNLDKLSQTMILEYISLPEQQREPILNYVNNIINSINKQNI